jgi:Na+-translocating ferredoxin:NAD+ oxidoreductase RNF subunit RnfB
LTVQQHHSLRIDSEKCSGCMSCMRVCPTEAVRVRRGRAVNLEDRCIDCGECIRACPRHAIIPLTDQMADLSKFDCTIALPSPALFAQFDTELSPGLIISALKRCGFNDVEPMSPACDAVMAATEIFLSEYRGQFPLISSFCPTVVQLVQVEYPELVDQLLPILAPREISARNAKARKARETGLDPQRVGTVYITPCPAKMINILDHPGMTRSYMDAAVSISDLFHTLASAIARVNESERFSDQSETATGISWAFLGGFPRSMPAENTLSVAGLPNVIRILDDIEKGKLRKYSFIECHACSEGCVGGCLTVENPYVARARIIKLSQRLPDGPVVIRDDIAQQYRAGSFRMDEPFSSRPLRPLDHEISKAIAKMKDRDRICDDLPGIDCGACGAPTCRAFAEDVVLGEAQEPSCIFFWRRVLKDQVESLAELVRLQDLPTGGCQ